MPEQLDVEPNYRLKELLANNWQSSNTTYSSDPRFTTGWWDWNRDTPTVSVTNAEERPLAGGEGRTGYAYAQGDGNVGQRYSGVALVNCWGGTYRTDALDGEDTDGSRLSPKVAAWEFAQEARRILRSFHEGTTKSDGSPQLHFVAPGTQRRLADTSDDGEYPTLFRYELEAKYAYHEES